jgi:hypothetical protein
MDGLRPAWNERQCGDLAFAFGVYEVEAACGSLIKSYTCAEKDGGDEHYNFVEEVSVQTGTSDGSPENSDVFAFGSAQRPLDCNIDGVMHKGARNAFDDWDRALAVLSQYEKWAGEVASIEPGLVTILDIHGSTANEQCAQPVDHPGSWDIASTVEPESPVHGFFGISDEPVQTHHRVPHKLARSAGITHRPSPTVHYSRTTADGLSNSALRSPPF